jgi:signal transduction histidine kinase
VADNGRTAGPKNGTGRGLANMRSRAALIGGTIALDHGEGGLTVALTLPGATAEPRP